MRSAVDLSATDQRLTPTVGAPAYMNARVSPITPSPRFSLPRPVSQTDSIRSGERGTQDTPTHPPLSSCPSPQNKKIVGRRGRPRGGGGGEKNKTFHPCGQN